MGNKCVIFLPFLSLFCVLVNENSGRCGNVDVSLPPHATHCVRFEMKQQSVTEDEKCVGANKWWGSLLGSGRSARRMNHNI